MSSPPKTVVVVFDLDRTLTRYGTFGAFLGAYVARRAQLWPRVAPALRTAFGYARGRVPRKAAKERILRLFFAGRSASEIKAAAEIFAARAVNQALRRGAAHAIETHRAAGHRLIMATACMDFVAEPIARRLGLGTVVATRSLRPDGERWAGGIDGPDCFGEAKLKLLAATLPKPKEEYFIVAYSDHPSDLPLLTWADAGIVVNPRAGFGKRARALGFKVVDWNATTAPEAMDDPINTVNQLKESFAK